jgi:hypothetical protein
MELILTSREREFLAQILEVRQRELLLEIARAENHQFRAGLKNNEELLESIISKVRRAQITGSDPLSDVA